MKNRKQQTLPMGRILKGVLMEYLQYRKADTEEDYLFPNAYGEPLSVRTLEKSLSSYNKRRGVLRTGVHIYRNVYAKKWIVSGGDIFRLQKMLNHNSLNMVREYVDMFTDDLQRDFDKFNALEQLQNSKKHIKIY
jgi:integrase/recombinase XerD